MNNAGEPVAHATVYDKEKDLSTTTNAQGKFMLKSPDTVVHVDVASVGYTSANATISNSGSNNIVLRETDQSLSDVVVTGTLRDKKAVNSSKARSLTQAEPEGGWRNFNEYLNNKVDSVKANNNNFSRNVVLEFSINKKGMPDNIRIQNKVDKQSEEAAKQILLNGPKWSGNTPGEKVKVTVPVNNQ